MALLACHLDMHTGQGIARLRVIELLWADGLPICRVVALRTIVAEAPLVRVLVAGDTGLRKPQEGAVQVFDFDIRPLGSRNLFW